jgi:hypothetical protein
MKWRKLYIILFLIFADLTLVAQSKVHVFTRTVTENFKYNAGDIIKINAFQADVTITGWNYDSISVIIRLKAKSTDYNAAKKDILNWAYAMKKEKTEIMLKNFLKKDISQNTTSKLTVEYNIRVPDNCLIHLSNFSGTTNINNLNGALKTNIKYGSLLISGMKGIVESDLEVGDINCTRSNLVLTLRSKHSAIYLDNVQGSITVAAQYGSVRINEIEPLTKLLLDVTRADVYLVKKSATEYRLDLYSMVGKINIDIPNYIKDMNKYKHEENTDYSKINYKSNLEIPLISIKNKYGNIVLN